MSRLLIRTPSQAQAVVDNLYGNMERRIAASPPGLCPVDMALNFLNLCHAQSCGKCTPCRIGLGQLSTLMRQVLDGEANMETLDVIRDTAQAIVDSTDCAIGTNAARLVLDGLEGFRDDYISHIQEKHCLGSLQNPVPCVALCPAGVDIPGYIALIAAGRLGDAVKLIRKDNPWPIACAYICEHPCEARCRRTMMDDPMNIRGLKKYAVNNAGFVPNPPCAPKTGKKVAVIGGGPGGLSAAYYLTLMGHEVTVYERHKQLGGMLRYGIPAYRFPREKIDEEIQNILSVGITAHTGVNVGTDISFEELKANNDALYIAIGAQTDKKTGMPGEDCKNVMSAVEMLGRIGDGDMPDFTGKKVVVIGGGNVAMDVCRSSVRLGAEKVSCVYRRRQVDMTALPEEVEGALAEGVEMLTLQAPVRIEADENGNAVALWTQPQVIGPMDKAYRPRPMKADTPENRIEADLIVLAIGQGVETHGFEQMGIKIKRGSIAAEEDSRIPVGEGIFAGGDCVTGPATAIRAIAAGKVAAANIDEYLGFNHEITTDVEVPTPRFNNKPPHGRVNLLEREAGERKRDFACIECEMSDQEAQIESTRCLRCDYFGYGNFKGGRNEKW
ncbi:MAG: FAD-dependent oxidoreductase [Oscillospiraceae bacterium]|nr:FAD-dependent oxidoreductase [Oscillospiraceae bacterium]